MDIHEMNAAFDNAERTLLQANQCAARAVRFSAGRLKRLALDVDTLRELKRELQHFNAKRGKWHSA